MRPRWSQAEVVKNSRDFYSMSTCRDLLLHAREDPLTIERLQAGNDDRMHKPTEDLMHGPLNGSQ